MSQDSDISAYDLTNQHVIWKVQVIVCFVVTTLLLGLLVT
jgi:hypothetical protein